MCPVEFKKYPPLPSHYVFSRFERGMRNLSGVSKEPLLSSVTNAVDPAKPKIVYYHVDTGIERWLFESNLEVAHVRGEVRHAMVFASEGIIPMDTALEFLHRFHRSNELEIVKGDLERKPTILFVRPRQITIDKYEEALGDLLRRVNIHLSGVGFPSLPDKNPQKIGIQVGAT